MGGEGIMYQRAQPKSLLTVSGVASAVYRSKGKLVDCHADVGLGCDASYHRTLVYLLVGYSSKAVLATRPQAARAVSMASGDYGGDRWDCCWSR